MKNGARRAAVLWGAVYISLALVGWQAALAQSAGGGDINLSPKRVVFDAAGHAASVYVFNRGTGPATYSISVIDRVMLPDGQILSVDDALKDPAKAAVAATVKSAKDYVVFTPRRVTLNPNESQTIRLRALKPNDLPPGEYRTHLTVTAVPPENAGLTAEQAAQVGSKQLAVKIIPIFSISIPLIVRQGDVDARAALEAPHITFEKSPADPAQKIESLNVTIRRLGTSSVYGNLQVRRGSELVGGVLGVGVYPEISQRSISIPLSKPPKPGDSLSVSFIDDDAHSGQELAKVAFTAP